MKQYDCKVVEMESFALFANAKALKAIPTKFQHDIGVKDS